MSWSIAEARARFSEVIAAAEASPQQVSSRGRPVAVIIAPEEYAAFEAWRRSRPPRSLADALDELRQVCAEEEYTLEVPARGDRPNAFAR